MKTTIINKQVRIAAACALALGIVSGTATAQSFGPNNERELWVDNGQQVWMNGFGECWHSAYGPTPPPNVCNPAKVAEYVAPPPPRPAPVVVAAAAPQPVYEKVSFDTNVLFDFDKSTLRPAGKDALDTFIAKVKGMTTETVTAVGYTDRFGTDSYNQKLSERRVATVKQYLASNGIVGRVDSSGRGESQPTTRPGECTGATATARTVACLQPDRHVFVEVTGTGLKQ